MSPTHPGERATPVAWHTPGGRPPTPLLKPRTPEPEAAPVAAPPSGSGALLWGALLVAGLAVAITGRRLLARPAK